MARERPRLRLGLLGAGDMGSMHANAYAGMDDVEIAGVVGRRPSRANALAARLGVPATTDPWVILDDESVEAVDITLPTSLHREFVTAALSHGKHVLCETPLASRAEDAEAMIATARASGRLLQVALLARVAEPGLGVQKLVRSGALGRPLVFSTERLWPGLGRAGAPDDHHGDALEELALFDLDYLVWSLGMPRTVWAAAPPKPHGEVDHVVAVLDFEGVQAFVEASRVMPQSFPFTIAGRVVCERGAVEWSLRFPIGTGAGAPPSVRVTRYDVAGHPETSDDLGPNPYDTECRHFIDSIRGVADPELLSGEAALAGLRVVDAARRSLGSGAPVALG